jgi:hypothetical protein
VQGAGHAGEPILISEFGGVKVAGLGAGWGYTEALSAEDFIVRYERLIRALTSSPVIQGFCYTQLADVEQEVNGLLTADRRPKVQLDRLREITLMAPAQIPQAA